jgi:hypothetical protein
VDGQLTQVRAKGKSDSMTTHIAYPDELLDDKKLIDLHQNAKHQKHQKHPNLTSVGTQVMSMPFSEE